MTLAEIKRALAEGLRVYWQTPSYEVVCGADGADYHIYCHSTGHSIKLTWADGLTLNGKEEEFYVSN